MFKKVLLSVVAAAAVTVAMMPVEASARWHGGWHGGGWRGPGWGYYGAPYYAYGPGYYAPRCYRTVRVATPYGWRWRRVWVCG